MSIEEFLALLPDGEQRERFKIFHARYQTYRQAMEDDPELKSKHMEKARVRVLAAMQIFFMTFEEEGEG